MFFRKKQQNTLQNTSPPWDAKTLDFFVKSDRFQVLITSAIKRTGFGTTREDETMQESNGYEISGLLTFPKHILATVSFGDEDERSGFGVWYYNRYRQSPTSDNYNLPALEFWISDPDWKVREAIFDSHKAGLLSGRRYSSVRFWKRPGDGIMTERDRQKGWSDESRYLLLGLYVWAELESTTLPNWAVPYGSEKFSAKDIPPSYDLKL